MRMVTLARDSESEREQLTATTRHALTVSVLSDSPNDLCKIDIESAIRQVGGYCPSNDDFGRPIMSSNTSRRRRWLSAKTSM
jgi:hypothetical protein